MKASAYPKGVKNRLPLMQLMMLLLFFLLFSGYVLTLTSYGNGGTRHSEPPNAAETADQADWNLATYNRTVAVGLLIGGSFFIIYCVKRSGKMRGRRKTGTQRHIHRG